MARRMLSLDAFRGLAVALMIAVDSTGVLGVAPTQLRHAEWHGLTVADVVFPSSWSRSGWPCRSRRRRNQRSAYSLLCNVSWTMD
jgi:predicted acyltransferase